MNRRTKRIFTPPSRLTCFRRYEFIHSLPQREKENDDDSLRSSQRFIYSYSRSNSYSRGYLRNAAYKRERNSERCYEEE